MTNLQLLEAIGLLDEKTVAEADQPVAKVLSTPRQRLTRQITAIAACACLLFGGALALHMGSWQVSNDAAQAPAAQTNAAAGGLTTAAVFTGGPSDEGALQQPSADATAEAPMNTTAAATWATTTTAYFPRTTTTAGNPAVEPEYPRTTTTAWTGTHAPSGATTTYYHTTHPDGTVTASTTVGTTVAEPEAGPPAWPVYTADLNGIPDTQDSAEAQKAIGIQPLRGAESDIVFGIQDGRLSFKQSVGESLFSFPALDEAYMESAVDSGFTLQYDLEYTAAAEAYAALVTEMTADGQSFRQFALRADGEASYRLVRNGIGSTLAATAGGIPTVGEIANIRMTVRVQWHPKTGHTVYVKTADMIDFVEVCAAVGGVHTEADGYAIGLAFGGAAEGYLDNIRIWLGWADAPSTAGIHYVPYTKAP